ncbi:MAG: ABC transporter ATP-binding protein [Spirochaetaceae bacterium]|nr:ABC transporter ATP-binding protein [Spirochaetaceae bacterium]
MEKESTKLEKQYAKNMEQNIVISVTNLRKRFNLEAGFFARLGRYVHAVNGVSLAIGKNETYGLVGESGCGKTTTARLLVRMYEADEGEITFQGRDGNIEDVRSLKGREFKQYRERVKYVFQDPARSLNPRMTVYEVLTSGARWAMKRHGAGGAAILKEEAASILEEVGLSASDLERRPAEFSGGQRQRISIARGLLMKPDLLICDEVVSALDVSIQGQILNLLLDLRSSRKSSQQELSFLFIAHDLKVACYFCDRIGVMYRGEIMEEAPAAEIWKHGLHPYTELLFSSAGKIPAQESPAAPAKTTSAKSINTEPEGCSFASRCPYAKERCFMEKPHPRTVGTKHLLRCWR